MFYETELCPVKYSHKLYNSATNCKVDLHILQVTYCKKSTMYCKTFTLFPVCLFSILFRISHTFIPQFIMPREATECDIQVVT